MPTALQNQIAADFLTFDDLEQVTHTRTGPNTSTVITFALCRQTIKNLDVPNVPCYMIDELVVHFLVSALSVDPKEGDTVTRGSTVYEVVEVKKQSADQRWRLVCHRAYLNTDYTTTCTFQRSTISQTAAKVDTLTWNTLASGVVCFRYTQSDPATFSDKLGVLGTRDVSTLYVMNAGVSPSPRDRVVVSGNTYTITSVDNDSRIALLAEFKLQKLQ